MKYKKTRLPAKAQIKMKVVDITNDLQELMPPRGNPFVVQLVDAVKDLPSDKAIEMTIPEFDKCFGGSKDNRKSAIVSIRSRGKKVGLHKIRFAFNYEKEKAYIWATKV